MASLCQRRSAYLILHSAGYFQNFHRLSCQAPYHLHHCSHRSFASKRHQQQESQQEDTSSRSAVSKPLPHHYSTLNIEPTASVDDIKKAYNNLMKQWHPDLYMNKPPTEQQAAQSKFLSIREAYETITKYKDGDSAESAATASGKINIHQAHGQRFQSGFTAGRRVPHASFSYYSWGRKVYETQQRAHQQHDGTESEMHGEEEEEEEEKYSETYKRNKSWIGRAIEDLYDWMVFLYQRNPVWVQFFMVAATSFSVIQIVWHLVYPHVDDADPDRIWNVFKDQKRGLDGYQPSSSAAMPSTPNMVALQPHFKGHTVYATRQVSEEEKEKDEKYRNRDFGDVEEESIFSMFVQLNLDSTVNNSQMSIKQGRKNKVRQRDDLEDTVVDADEAKSETVIDALDSGEQHGENIKRATQINVEDGKTKEVKLRKPELKYNDIPLELRSTPMGMLLASYAADSGTLPPVDENGQYDWSEVVEKFRTISDEEVSAGAQ